MPKHNTRKRKYLLPGKNLIKGKAEVKTLHLADMVICVNGSMNRPGFPGECFICELRLPDHRFRWKHNKLFLL
ncbi:hypothetical protein, partial [Escherichia coli]|uniref:hypothetical protein n=1 Tax=Escherichia coli TaxID=562 RepID=UPI001F2AD865